jgi:hypothetical protein
MCFQCGTATKQTFEQKTIKIITLFFIFTLFIVYRVFIGIINELFHFYHYGYVYLFLFLMRIKVCLSTTVFNYF